MDERSEKTRSTPEGSSGRSDTGRGHVCRCGRVHPKQRRSRAIRRPIDHVDLTRRVYDALAEGKAERGKGNRWTVHYAGNCEAPMVLRQTASTGALFAEYKVRCRKCPGCLRARQFYWSRAAVANTEATAERKGRTWFGTLTLTPEWQQEALRDARDKWCNLVANTGAIPDWWDEVNCDERFRLHRNEVQLWLQRYWKRLRKGVKRCTKCYPKKPRSEQEWDHPAARFTYLAVFERHPGKKAGGAGLNTGLPHVHFLLHEGEGCHILLKQLACEWPHGFVKMKLVKGDDLTKAGYYVAKYLGKDQQSRQIASIGYTKINRPKGKVFRKKTCKQSADARPNEVREGNAPARATHACAGVRTDERESEKVQPAKRGQTDERKDNGLEISDCDSKE